MKKVLFTILLNFVIAASAFGIGKIDSIYYLLDTAKTQLSDRLWEIHEEYPSIKMYTINCPCLQYDNLPTFVENAGTAKPQIINKKELFGIKFITLVRLISEAKQTTTNKVKKDNCAFFFIEPIGNKFVVHHVRLRVWSKPREPNKDYIILPGVDSTKLKKP